MIKVNTGVWMKGEPKMLKSRKILVALLLCSLLLGVAGIAMATEPDHTHVPGTPKVITDATCDSPGHTQTVCTICNEILLNDYNSPPAKGHTWSQYYPTATASCTAEGEETRRCSVCNITQSQPTPKKPHQMSGWQTVTIAKCGIAGSETNRCHTCDTQTTTQPIPALEHVYNTDWVEDPPAKCEDAGTAKRFCSLCGVPATQNIPALGHNFGLWSDAEDPAKCETPGTLKRICMRCGEFETKVAPKLGHNYGPWVETDPPSCIKDGAKSRTCSRCGDVQTEVVKAYGKSSPYGHAFSSWSGIVDATCTKEGTQTRTCSDCGREEKGATPRIPHTSDGNWVTVREASTKELGLQITHCTVCGQQADSQTAAPRGFRYEVPTFGYGLSPSEIPGGMGGGSPSLIILDLSADSDQRYALVTEDGWLVGYARVTVSGGTVRVSLEKTVESNLLRYRAWNMFPDATMAGPVFYDTSLPFDQAVQGPGETCAIAITLLTNYYQGGANQRFSDGMIAPGSGLSYQELNMKMLELSEQSES